MNDKILVERRVTAPPKVITTISVRWDTKKRLIDIREELRKQEMFWGFDRILNILINTFAETELGKSLGIEFIEWNLPSDIIGEDNAGEDVQE